MTRQLRTTSQNVSNQIGRAQSEKTRRAYLVGPYKDKVATVLVQFSEPRFGSRGTAVRARISPGTWGLDTAAPQLNIGSPVTVVIRRGIVFVVGF